MQNSYHVNEEKFFQVARLVLLWVNNHFNDFETNSAMMSRLEKFEFQLDKVGIWIVKS